MTISLLNVVQHYKNLPHQRDALLFLEAELHNKHPELLAQFAARFRSDRRNEFPPQYMRAMVFVKRVEGLLTDDPNDTGGRTFKGVTQSVYNSWRRSKNLPLQDVARMSDQEKYALYYERYWTPAHCALMRYPLDLTVMDTAVNFGVNNAFSFISEALGRGLIYDWTPIAEDTLAANPKQLSVQIVKCRLAYRPQRVQEDPTQKKFLKGWINRDNALMRLVEAA